MNLLYLFPGIELYFASAITLLLFIRWRNTKDKTTFYWMLAFGFYTLYDIIQILFVSGVAVFHALSYFMAHFVRQTCISLMFVSLYYGIINLLTNKKLLTQVLPITFFTLQELLLAYGDFMVNNVELSDKLHVVFFDVPFNLVIALLFFKLYQVNRKRYSVMISAAGFGYALSVPIFFYWSGNVIIYTISLLPMLIMFLAFFFFYHAPTGEELMEITPTVEKRLATEKRYRLKPGYSYLVEEPKSLKAFDIFVDAVMHGIRGLCITRQKPARVRRCYELERTPVLWLTQVSGETGEIVDPAELEQLIDLIDKFVQKAKEQEIEEEVGSMPDIDKYAMSGDEIKALAEKEEASAKAAFLKESMTPDEIAEAEKERDIEESEVSAAQAEAQKEDAYYQEEPKPKLPSSGKGKMIVIGDDEDMPHSPAKSPSHNPAHNPLHHPAERRAPSAEHGSVYPVFRAKPKEAAKPTVNPTPQSSSSSPKPQPRLQVYNQPVSHNPIKHIHEKLKQFVQRSPAQKPAFARPRLFSQAPAAGQGASILDSHNEPAPDSITAAPARKKGKLMFIGADDDVKKKLQHSANLQHKAYLAVGSINHRKSIILLDGLEYLISNNSFESVKNMLTFVKDKISEGNSCLLVPVDPDTLTKEQVSQLEQEFYLFDPEKTDYL